MLMLELNIIYITKANYQYLLILADREDIPSFFFSPAKILTETIECELYKLFFFQISNNLAL